MTYRTRRQSPRKGVKDAPGDETSPTNHRRKLCGGMTLWVIYLLSYQPRLVDVIHQNFIIVVSEVSQPK